MIGSMEANRSVKAFDREVIHAGNKGLRIDHASISVEVDALLGSLSLEQKIHELHGWQMEPIDGFYYAGGDAALGIEPWKMADGPRGARVGKATAFPVAIARGATFDPELERRVGMAAGAEIAAKGGNVILAPTINLLRHPGWGRAQETYSEDTHHMGAMGVAYISGAQNWVLTSPKHFALNNLEMTRFQMSANANERVLHEVYLPHFKRCVVEGAAASVMSAYNRVNGVYCGEHPILLTDILREDWGFKGFVESDWILGTRSTAKAINAGMDIEMPVAYRFEREKIDAALSGGELDEAVITRNARRSLYQKLAWDIAGMDRPDASVVESKAHLELAREAAEKSFVLLKNESLLPLQEGQRIAVVGELADTVNLGDRGSSMVQSTTVVTPLQGLQSYSNQVSVSYLEAETDPARLSAFDVCIVVAGLTYREEGEFIPIQQQEAEENSLARGGDRADLRLPAEQEDMINQAAAADVPVVVLVEAGSAIDMSAWIEKVAAVVMIWYPGCEGGHAVARVLFGDVNPSGRLPVSFPRALDQLMPWDIDALDVEHDLYHGYRYLDQKGETPLFPFGFGLSYTTFGLDGLQVERAGDRFFFNVTVTNTGDRAGAAVVQLYQSNSKSQVERVMKEMKGFGRVEIEAGETVDLEIEVEDENLCYFEAGRGWLLEACNYHFRVGLSSDALELESVWAFDGEDWEPR